MAKGKEPIVLNGVEYDAFLKNGCDGKQLVIDFEADVVMRPAHEVGKDAVADSAAPESDISLRPAHEVGKDAGADGAAPGEFIEVAPGARWEVRHLRRAERRIVGIMIREGKAFRAEDLGVHPRTIRSARTALEFRDDASGAAGRPVLRMKKGDTTEENTWSFRPEKDVDWCALFPIAAHSPYWSSADRTTEGSSSSAPEPEATGPASRSDSIAATRSISEGPLAAAHRVIEEDHSPDQEQAEAFPASPSNAIAVRGAASGDRANVSDPPAEDPHPSAPDQVEVLPGFPPEHLDVTCLAAKYIVTMSSIVVTIVLENLLARPTTVLWFELELGQQFLPTLNARYFLADYQPEHGWLKRRALRLLSNDGRSGALAFELSDPDGTLIPSTGIDGVLWVVLTGDQGIGCPIRIDRA